MSYIAERRQEEKDRRRTEIVEAAANGGADSILTIFADLSSAFVFIFITSASIIRIMQK